MRFMKKALLPVLAICLLIGALPVSALSGDFNGDNTVDVADARYYLYHVMLPQAYPLDNPTDYTGDGIASSADAIYLLYYVMAPDEYPLLGNVTLPATGYDPDNKGRIQLAEISRNGNVVTVAFKNKSATWVPDETTTIGYTCTDADGKVLETGEYYLGYIKCGETISNQIVLPADTAALTFTGATITYWGVWK